MEAVVEAIWQSRRRGSKTEYFVKWFGYDESENTWEPAANLHEELVADFDAADTEFGSFMSDRAISGVAPACTRRPPPRKTTASDLETADATMIAPSGKRRKLLASAADDDANKGRENDSHPTGKYAPRLDATPPFKTSPVKFPVATQRLPEQNGKKRVYLPVSNFLMRKWSERTTIPAMRHTLVSVEKGDMRMIADWRLKLPKAYGPGWSAEWIEPEGFKRLQCYEGGKGHGDGSRKFRELMLPKLIECLKV